jgi:hypothetical protein
MLYPPLLENATLSALVSVPELAVGDIGHYLVILMRMEDQIAPGVRVSSLNTLRVPNRSTEGS